MLQLTPTPVSKTGHWVRPFYGIKTRPEAQIYPHGENQCASKIRFADFKSIALDLELRPRPTFIEIEIAATPDSKSKWPSELWCAKTKPRQKAADSTENTVQENSKIKQHDTEQESEAKIADQNTKRGMYVGRF